MEFRHIRYFIAVAEELNFHRAARALHVSQPPLSQQIRQLEDEFGLKLFDRTKRQIRLTDAGQIFLPEARRIIAQVEQARQVVARAGRGEIGQLRIGFMMPQHSRVVAEFFRVFAEAHPHVHLTSHPLAPTEPIAALRNDRVDVAFLRLPADGAGAVIEPILKEPLMVAISDRHVLCARNRLALRSLRNHPWMVRPRYLDPTLHDLVLETFRKAGITVEIAYEQTDIYTAMGIIGAGLAVCLVPASIQQLPVSHVAFRKLQPPAYVETGMAYRPDDKSIILAQFIAIVRGVSRRWH